MGKQIQCSQSSQRTGDSITPIPVLCLFSKHTDVSKGGCFKRKNLQPMADLPLGGNLLQAQPVLRFSTILHDRNSTIVRIVEPLFTGWQSAYGRRTIAKNSDTGKLFQFCAIAEIEQFVLTRFKQWTFNRQVLSSIGSDPLRTSLYFRLTRLPSKGSRPDWGQHRPLWVKV